MDAGRQHDAVPRMAVADGSIHEQDPAVGRAQRRPSFGEKCRIAAEDRCGQRSASALRESESFLFIAIRNNRCYRTEHFELVDQIGIAALANF